MQALTACTRACRARVVLHGARRCISTTPAVPQHLGSSPLPWFVDPSEVAQTPSTRIRHPTSPRAHAPLPPLPSSIPEDSHVARLHAALASSPFLEPGTLLVTEPIPTADGPALPRTEPKGRRKRGRTYSGEGIPDSGANLWNWVVIAQVKTGTESRGAIESVMRVVRKTLLSSDPPLPLPHNHKRRVSDGWSMLDAGDFAVHIVSRSARERYFPDERRWQSIFHMHAITGGRRVSGSTRAIGSTVCPDAAGETLVANEPPMAGSAEAALVV
ncbi:hypothetical protein NM688_g5480 [Phlebia brevispora]|uniref:Uncharacterized protein n=1 Tax=Phlebia brevispora TaxID=194682 RepID=A0ACC1SVA2_9APHY|nr:hypothetical protein NM688_g5480 [Phlebia brevispora]